MSTIPRVDYQTSPDRYRHWRLGVDGPIATLALDVDADAGLRPGYTLKLNSYDLGVDIELNDALNRIRFTHPGVRAVVITSARDRLFCSGANIYMLGLSSHAWKVNFCKFTNETRNGIEDSSRHDGLKFIAAVNGSCAGGGYELALCCDEIILIDDRSSTVSLPEVPLLGVLPGTGGLTRLTDKRHVRHDLADIFCTTAEGVRGQRARDWRLIDHLARPAVFDETVRRRALALAANGERPEAAGIVLNLLQRAIEADSLRYSTVNVTIDRARRHAVFTVFGPSDAESGELAAIEAAGAAWYPLRMARELDDAILEMRTNETEIGTWLLRTEGDPAAVLAMDRTLLKHKDHWLVRATIGLLRRTIGRLDVSARSLFALIEPGSCFSGTLLELALACDRSYQREAASVAVSEANFILYPMITGQSRLGRRFYDDASALEAISARTGETLDAGGALSLGLITAAPDDIDWDDEIRLALEERAAMSPDALTGLEANLRFNGPETMLTRIFARLTAWQNWIFQRPNAVGEKGALSVYGTGERPRFDWNRV